jgi:hypothetical protein
VNQCCGESWLQHLTEFVPADTIDDSGASHSSIHRRSAFGS